MTYEGKDASVNHRDENAGKDYVPPEVSEADTMHLSGSDEEEDEEVGTVQSKSAKAPFRDDEESGDDDDDDATRYGGSDQDDGTGNNSDEDEEDDSGGNAEKAPERVMSQPSLRNNEDLLDVSSQSILEKGTSLL